MDRHEVIIIGAGPIGLEVCAALRAADIDSVVLDSGPIGATIIDLFPPSTRFFSSPDRLEIAGCAFAGTGQEKSTREEYLAYLRSVVSTRSLDVRTFHEVIGVERNDDGFHLKVRTRSGAIRSFFAPRVVVATGGTGRVRTLGIPGEDLPHVRHHLGDPHQYMGRRVLVVGGKNSACESALRCWRVGAEVHIACRGAELHERVKYWIRPELVALIEEGLVHAHFNTTVEQIDEERVLLANHAEGTSRSLEFDDVLMMIGYEQDSRLLASFGVELEGDQQQPVFDAGTMESTIKGVYVAGTATAGTQDRFRVFIENCHVHADRIAAAIAGMDPPPERTSRRLEEN